MKDSSDRKQLVLLGLAGAVLTILLSALFADLFRAWEWKTMDLRFKWRGPIPTDSRLIMIDADDSSAEVYGRWPWKRSIHAKLIDFLKDSGAKTIAYDILFSRPGDPAEDVKLIEAVRSSHNLVFPFIAGLTETPPETRELENPNNLAPATSLTQDYWFASDPVFPLPALKVSPEYLGHIDANRDSDGVIRRVPLLVNLEGKRVPSLAFRAILDYLDVSDVSLEVGEHWIVLPTRPEVTRIPIDSKGQMLINYTGRWQEQETFKHASFASVLSAGKQNPDYLEDLEGKLVLVANTMTGGDIKSIPFEKDYPAAGVHANIINTLLTGNFLKQTHPSTNHTLVLLACIGVALLYRNRNYPMQTGAVFGATLVYVMVCAGFFSFGILLPLVTPATGIILTALLVVSYKAGTEKETRDTLDEEKKKLESRLESILNHLKAKNDELAAIKTQLDTLEAGMSERDAFGKSQAEKIRELQNKMQILLEDREQLEAKREELENKVLDLRVHITFDEPVKETLQSLADECKRYGLITRTRKVLDLFATLKKVAPIPTPVLITGESGTGKELFARALHQMSKRKGNFVALNMGAIPETLIESELFGHEKGAFTSAVRASKGKFREAEGGTIFLDEIGEASKGIQVKLLRAIQEKEVQSIGGQSFKVDVRIVAATNQVLENEVRENRFREDLFFRLNALTLELPPLRKRKEDIELVACHFVEKYGDEYGKSVQGLSDKAMQNLMNYGWPGNIRELENVIQRGITFAGGDLIQEKDLGLNSEKELEQADEKGGKMANGDTLLLLALRENNFEINATAAQLKMNRNTVSSRFKGICFDLLVKHRGDIEKATSDIVDNDADAKFVRQKIDEYYENLVRIAAESPGESEAINEALRRSKNVPTRHHPSIENLIQACFEDKQKEL